MLRKLGCAGLVGAALVALPALALPVAAQTDNETFVKEQALNQWRASKLVGVSVMGQNQEKIGKIADVLLDHDGNAQVVVVSVGGFLGMGAKAVGVPFKTMQWRTEGRTVAVGDPPTTPAGTDATHTTIKSNPQAVEANQGYPDMGVLDMTKAQLQNAPDFKYAPSPTADAGTTATPAAGAAGPPPKTNP